MLFNYIKWLLMSILLINGCSFNYIRCLDDCLPTSSLSTCKEICKNSYP